MKSKAHVRMKTERTGRAPGNPARENRWCEKYGYFIDIDACKARAAEKTYCGICLCRWRQLRFPFFDDL